MSSFSVAELFRGGICGSGFEIANFVENLFTPAGVVGIVAVLVGIVSLASKNDAKLRLLNLVCVSLWVVHYILLSAWPAAFAMLLSIPSVVAGMIGSFRLGVLSNLLLVGQLLLTVFHGPTVKTSMPPFASLLMGVAVSFLAGWRMTLLLIVAQVFWMVYGGVIGSLPVIVSSSLMTMSLVFRWLRPAKPEDLPSPVAGRD